MIHLSYNSTHRSTGALMITPIGITTKFNIKPTMKLNMIPRVIIRRFRGFLKLMVYFAKQLVVNQYAHSTGTPNIKKNTEPTIPSTKKPE